jgi:pimeloyl-ACP methyl ester carboxylesterase
MVPPANAAALARQFPDATVAVYPDSGHGVAFQHHREFGELARRFLRR